MTLCGRSSKWAAALVLGLVGLIGVGAATVRAAPVARTAASAFELTLDGELTGTPGEITSQGTFRSRAPFCATGVFVDERPDRPVGGKRQFTCDDGTGTLTVSIAGWEYYGPPFNTTWQILDGSGSYRDLRGRGSVQGEMLSDYGFAIWRSTFQGLADRDTIAPSSDISSARVTKLPRPAGAYAIKLALGLRDNVEENPVSYRVRISARGRGELARKFGTARTGAVSLALRVVVPSAKVKTIGLQVTASDPFGNAVSLRRALSLPR
jgi:hypothetical protein